jgi:cytochrome c oxidase accessory protein FixG
MDQHSMAVAYDEKGGEPRKKRGEKSTEQDVGDCVDCHRCIDVCPTGIDIRNGIQMECLACTNCVDACDAVMQKFKKPEGLIRYTTLEELDTGKKAKNIRARTIVYIVLISVLAIGLSFALLKRSVLRINAIRAIDTPYQIISEAGQERIINHFRLKIHNQGSSQYNLEISPTKKSKELGVQLIIANRDIKIISGKSHKIDVFIKFPSVMLKMGSAKAMISFKAKSSDVEMIEIPSVEVSLVGPFK